MRQPPGFQEISKDTGRPYVWRLTRSLYGIPSNEKLWNMTVDKALKGMNWTATASDSCLYQRGHGDYYSVMALYVDDCLITSKTEEQLQHTRNELESRFKIKRLGTATKFLGV